MHDIVCSLVASVEYSLVYLVPLTSGGRNLFCHCFCSPEAIADGVFHSGTSPINAFLGRGWLLKTWRSDWLRLTRPVTEPCFIFRSLHLVLSLSFVLSCLVLSFLPRRKGGTWTSSPSKWEPIPAIRQPGPVTIGLSVYRKDDIHSI